MASLAQKINYQLGYLLFAILVFLAGENTIFAHTPHDPIDALALSPNYNHDKTVFIAISDQLFKSTDGGYSWKELINGLDNKGLLSAIAVSPWYADDGLVFVLSKRDGIYRSENKGSQWQNISNELSRVELKDVFISSNFKNDGMIFVTGAKGGLYRSLDRGTHWHLVFDKHIRITSMAFYSKNDALYCLLGDQGGNIYFSQDNGDTWQKLLMIPDCGMITSIVTANDTGSDWVAFVGTEKRGIFKYEEGWKKAQKTYNALGGSHVTSLQISSHRHSDHIVWAATWNEAVYISYDTGNTWKHFSEGLTKDQQADSAHYRSPHFRRIQLSNHFKIDQNIFLGGFDGLFKSVDGGMTWIQLETLPLGHIRGIDISQGGKEKFVIGIATYGGGAYLSPDQGKSWTVLNSGLLTTRLTDLIFPPDYPSDNVIYSASQGYLLKWNKRKKAWDRHATSKRTLRNRLHQFSYRLGPAGAFIRKYISQPFRKPYPNDIVLSPNYLLDQTIYFSTRWDGIFKSTNGGIESRAIWNEVGAPITAIAISPHFISDNTLFASIRGEGVIRSTDGGDHFNPVNKGLTFLKRWRQTETHHQITNKNIKLAISPNYQIDQTVFCATSEGLYITNNAGEEWKRSPGQAFGENGYILAIALTATNNENHLLVLSVKGKGLFKSEDMGLSFTALAPHLITENHKIEHIAFSKDFRVDQTLLAASDEALFISTDGGENWRILARPVRYENHREVITYHGEWTHQKGEPYSATSIHQANMVNSRTRLDFIGTGVEWLGMTSAEHGIANVYIDDEFVTEIDQYSPSKKWQVCLYSTANLPHGHHFISIEVTDKKNPSSTGHKTSIDAFDIMP